MNHPAQVRTVQVNRHRECQDEGDGDGDEKRRTLQHETQGSEGGLNEA
jgi:hypothetical protein